MGYSKSFAQACGCAGCAAVAHPWHQHCHSGGQGHLVGSGTVCLPVLWCSPKGELEKRTRGWMQGNRHSILTSTWHALRLQQALACLGQLGPVC